MMKLPTFGVLCLAVMTTALLSLSSSSSSSCVSAFTFLAATKAVAPTKGGKEAKVVKEKPAVKKQAEKKIIVSKKKKLGVDKSKDKKKKVKVVAKKEKPKPEKKKKVIPKVSDPSLELTRKLVQQKKKGSALDLKKRKEKEFSLAPSIAQKLKKKKQVLSKTQLKRREEKVEVDTTQLQTLLPSLPSLPAFGGGKKVVVKSDSGADKKVVDYSAVINPIDFVFRVVNSDKGQEAVPVLIDGGLKLLSAILEEGKQSKVEISGGYDKGTGNLKKTKVVNIGLKQLLDGALFTGGEFLPTIKKTYEKLYVGGEGEKTKITRIAAKVDKKTGKVLKPTEETYFVTIGGTRQRVIKKV